jgi:hypothetical protein
VDRIQLGASTACIIQQLQILPGLLLLQPNCKNTRSVGSSVVEMHMLQLMLRREL